MIALIDRVRILNGPRTQDSASLTHAEARLDFWVARNSNVASPVNGGTFAKSPFYWSPVCLITFIAVAIMDETSARFAGKIIVLFSFASMPSLSTYCSATLNCTA